jgi:hypothetical protein
MEVETAMSGMSAGLAFDIRGRLDPVII